MMPKYKRQFQSPEYIEEGIMNDAGRKVGTIRLKPVSVAWKPANAREYRTVPLDRFIEWITSDEAKARRTKT